MLVQGHWVIWIRRKPRLMHCYSNSYHSGQKINLQAGTGIVADSDPEMEFKETINKAKGIFYASLVAEMLDQ